MLELVGHVLVPMVDGIVEVEVIHIVHIEIIVAVDQGKTKIAECVPYFFSFINVSLSRDEIYVDSERHDFI